MKRSLLIAFWATQVLVYKTDAQEVSITGISPESFSGVRSVNNGELYYVAFMDDVAQDSGSVALRVFDRGMQPRREINLPVAKGTQLAASAFTGQFYILQLVNPGNKSRTTVVVDEGGNIFKRKDETDIKPSVLSPASFPAIYPVSSNDYLVIRTNRDGKSVFEMELMDTELGSRWQKTLESSSGSEVIDFKTEMDRLSLLQKTNAGHETYLLRTLSGMAGDDFFSTEIRDGENMGVPGFIEAKNGFITAAGIFQRESSPGKSEGLFFAKLDPTGKAEQIQFAPWRLIKTQVKNSIISDLETGKIDVLFQGAIPDANEEGVTLVGELYKKTAGAEANTATFSVQDMILVHIRRDGQVDKVSQISKPTRSVLVKGSLSAKSSADMAYWFDKKQFFGYRAALPVGGNAVIAYIDNKKGKATGYFATLDSTGAVPPENITTLDIERQGAETSKTRKTDKSADDVDVTVLNSTEKDIRDFASTYSSRDIVPVQEGHVLISNFTAPDLRFWVIPVPMRRQ